MRNNVVGIQMLLSKEQVEQLHLANITKVQAVISSLPSVVGPGSPSQINYALAAIYKELLDSDPHAVIFNLLFAICVECTSAEQAEANIKQLQRILPIYLTYKDAGFANLEQLKDSEHIDNVELTTFKLLGNIRSKQNSATSAQESVEALYSALFLYATSINLINAEDKTELDNLTKYLSQLCALSLHQDGHELLMTRREGIMSEVANGYEIRNVVQKILTDNAVYESLQTDFDASDVALEHISAEIAAEEARKHRIAQRRLALEKNIAEISAQLNAVSESNINSIKAQLAANNASIDQQLAKRNQEMMQWHKDRMEDIKYSFIGGSGPAGMPIMPFSSNGPVGGPNNIGIKFQINNKGPDVVAYRTHNGTVQSFSVREFQIANMQQDMARIKAINAWWDNNVTHTKTEKYVTNAFNLVKPITLPTEVPITFVDKESKPKVNIINPYVASLVNNDNKHLAEEQTATKNITHEAKTVGGIVKQVIAGDATIGQKIKQIFAAIKEADFSSVEKRLAERDQLLREVKQDPGHIPESSQSAMGLAAVATAVKNIVRDARDIVTGTAKIMADAALLENKDPAVRAAAWDRTKQRAEELHTAKTVLTHPSIIGKALEERAKQNAENFATNYAAGKLAQAGQDVGEQLYDIYNITSIGLGAGALASSATTKAYKTAKNIYDTHDIVSPIVLQFDMSRLNSGIPIDCIKIQNPFVKKVLEATKTNHEGGVTWQGINLGEGVKAYDGKALGYVDPRYIAHEKLVVEMPFVGIGHPDANTQGFLRDLKYYWNEVLKKSPELFSPANIALIKKGKSPIVDQQIMKILPQYNFPEFKEMILVHHHIGGGNQAFGIPAILHPGFGGVHVAEKLIGIQGSTQKVSEVLQRLLTNSSDKYKP